MVTFDISLWRVLLAAIVGYLIGWIWFTPALFGDAWKKLHKLRKKDLEAGRSPRVLGLGFVGTFITALALAITLSAWGVATASEATIVALILAIGFVATANLSFVLWGNEPEGAYLINSLFLTLQMVVMAMVLTW